MRRHAETGELRWLLHQARPYGSLYALRIATVLLTSFLALVDPLILKWLIDDVLPWEKTEMVFVAAAGFLCVFLFRFSLTALSLLVDTYTSQRLAYDLRNGFLQHLQALSADFHQNSSKGQLLHNLEQDIDQICEVGGHSLASLLRIVTMTLLSVFIMLLLNWKLTLLLLPLVPVMVLLRRHGQERLKQASDRVQAGSAERVGFLQDHLGSILQVQLLNRNAGERLRFARLGREVLEARVERQGKELWLSFSSQVALVLATTFVLGFGGFQVLAGALTIGGLVAFYSYLNRIFGPVETVVHLYAELQRAMASIRRVRKVLRVRPTITEPTNPKHLRRTGSVAVQLREVEFHYQSSKPVLDGLDLALRPGERVALVGASGSGKSTVARLLTRQYDPQGGGVLLDGVPVRDLRLRDLRSHVALVAQDPLLFDTTLRENLLLANPDAGERELHRVLAMAQLETTVKELPEGLDEPVGPRGERLSGGQRQRVAVARAILQNPRLLLLDEATSALDGFTEHRLFSALAEFIRDRTVLLIAHRLSAIRWAARIVVLADGRVVASGTHDELYTGCSLYRGLCEEQLQDRPAKPVSDPGRELKEDRPRAQRMAM